MNPNASDEAVPPRLAERMRELLREAGVTAEAPGPEALLDAAVHALRHHAGAATDTALDLLAIDGLATRAFTAVDDPAELEALADRACARLLALGEAPV